MPVGGSNRRAGEIVNRRLNRANQSIAHEAEVVRLLKQQKAEVAHHPDNLPRIWGIKAKYQRERIRRTSTIMPERYVSSIIAKIIK